MPTEPHCDLSVGNLVIGDLAVGELVAGADSTHSLDALFVNAPLRDYANGHASTTSPCPCWAWATSPLTLPDTASTSVCWTPKPTDLGSTALSALSGLSTTWLPGGWDSTCWHPPTRSVLASPPVSTPILRSCSVGTKPRQVEVIVQDGAARIVPAGQPRPRGQCVVEALLGKGDVDLTTDEIMAMTRGD